VRWALPPISGFALMCILFVLVIRSPLFLGDSDTGWHIRTGDLIRQTGTVPHHDVFSHTMPGRDWFAWEWLTDVAMSVVHSNFGLLGITKAALIVLFLSYALLLRVALRRGADVFVASGLVIFGAWTSMVHWLARPHILSILLMLVWCILLDTWRRHRAAADLRAYAIYLTPLLIAFWANVHGGFIVTFPMLVIYAAGDILEGANRRVIKTYLITGGACVAASLATPYGVRLYRHLLGYVTDSQLLGSINEFQSPNFHDVAGKSIEILLFFAAVALLRAVLTRRYVEAGLLLFWAHLSLQSLRHVPLATVVVVPIIAEHCSALLSEFAKKFDGYLLFKLVGSRHRGFTAIDRQLSGGLTYLSIAVFMFVLISGRSAQLNELMQGKFDEVRLPVAAADFLETLKPAGRVYSSDQFGGYLIYRFYPRMKVFIDGRSDFYRTGDVVKDYLNIASVKPDWSSLLDKYEVNWMLLSPREALTTLALTSGHWTSVYCDDTAQVLVRKPRSGERM